MEDALTLSDLAPGDVAIVDGYVKGQAEYRRRLMVMGLTRGVSFEVVRVAPLGDPVQIRVRESSVTLRKDEARSLRIRRAD
jgi:ferrous iron transport protein A